MPQMAPIYWSFMFLMFMAFLIFTLVKLSFSKSAEAPFPSGKKFFLKLGKNWQW